MTARAEVERRVRADLAGAVDDVVTVVRRQVPAYAVLSQAQQREVAAIATWAIERVLELWVADVELTPADVRRFQGIGAARALDGRPLPGLLRAYRVGAARVTDLVEQVGGDVLTAGDALALARLWMGALDLLSEALYDGYARATTRLTTDRAAALGDLLIDIVSGRQSVRTALADRCRALDVELPPQPLVLVGETVVAPDAVLLAHHDGLDVALLHTRPDALPGRACVVSAHGSADVPRAHRLADLVVRSAPTRAFGLRLLDEGDAQVLALLHGHRDADPTRLAPGVLGAAADQPTLVEALDAYLRTGSAAGAAHELGLHPQSVRHRLRRLREVSGRSTGRPWDRFTLEAARS